MFREVLQRSKQLEIFRFLPRISYLHHNGHSGSYPTGLPCQNGNFAVVAHISLKFFRRSRATFWGLAGHFWPAGHRLGTTDVAHAIYKITLTICTALLCSDVVLEARPWPRGSWRIYFLVLVLGLKCSGLEDYMFAILLRQLLEILCGLS